MEALKEESSGLLTNMSDKERYDNQLKQLENQVATLKESVKRIYQYGWNIHKDHNKEKVMT